MKTVKNELSCQVTISKIQYDNSFDTVNNNDYSETYYKIFNPIYEIMYTQVRFLTHDEIWNQLENGLDTHSK